ncbi:hypothetical protein IHE45_20G060700 [Dioscorea alata]|uniref:Uncharacterized protein n=1 Tax=Dioscorea alata TaxID=55571 RepID=A0ACB7TS83_DIOAL|nr:hypothetical protein IHE45_20G060700 [Dioscorea alata]
MNAQVTGEGEAALAVEDEARDAQSLGDVGQPREADVGDDARRRRVLLAEKGEERVSEEGGAEEEVLDEEEGGAEEVDVFGVGERDEVDVLAAVGETGGGAREGELKETDGEGGGEDGGDGGAGAGGIERGGDESGENAGAVSEKASNVNHGDDVALGHQWNKDYVSFVFTLLSLLCGH